MASEFVYTVRSYMRKPWLLLVIIPALVLPALPQKSPASAAKRTAASAAGSDILLDILQTELARATTELAKAENPPYFISYAVHDSEEKMVAASSGAILTSLDVRRRSA